MISFQTNMSYGSLILVSENQGQELLRSNNKRIQILIKFEDKKLQHQDSLLYTNKYGHYLCLSRLRQK